MVFFGIINLKIGAFDMKRDGFIATSLLYTFFIIFCALLLALVGNFLHNSNLLEKLVNDVKKDLTSVGNRLASDERIKIGDCFEIPLSFYQDYRYGAKINDSKIKWFVFDKGSETISLVSEQVLYYTNKPVDVTNFEEHLKNEIKNYFSLYTTELANMDYVGSLTNVHITKMKTEALPIRMNLLNGSWVKQGEESANKYLFLDGSNAYMYAYSCANNADNCTESKVPVMPTASGKYGVRLVIVISSNSPMIGGNGTVNAPYLLGSYAATESLVLHYDAINNTGNLGHAASISSTLCPTGKCIKDLSGTNHYGVANGYTLNADNLSLTAAQYIDTGLSANDFINNNSNTPGYTIEFSFENSFTLSIDNINNRLFQYDGTVFKIFNTQNDVTTNFTSAELALKSGFNTIAMVREAGVDNQSKLYVNGAVINKPAPALFTISGNLLIGGTGNGSFKSIRIYKKALTEEEIKNNYQLRWNQ